MENPFLNLNAAATGIIIIDDTTSNPTTFMDADIVKLSNMENKILYSTASIWEITIKHMLHPEKLRMNGNILEKGCEDNG